ncbi:zinc-binding dehydrogenase [Granulicella aggregans]
MAAGPLEGRQILIIGGGPIAQLCLRWCIHQRGTVSLMTRSSISRSAALRGGASCVLDCKTSSPEIREHMSTLGVMPDVIIDCTSDASVLSWALGSVADYGRIVLVGDPGEPRDRKFTSDLLLRGLSVCGVHDRCTFNKWTDEAAASVFFSALNSRSFRTDDLVSRTYPSSSICELYETLASRGEMLGLLIDWQNQTESV